MRALPRLRSVSMKPWPDFSVGALRFGYQIAGHRPVELALAALHDQARVELLMAQAHMQQRPAGQDAHQRQAAAERGVVVVVIGRQRRRDHDPLGRAFAHLDVDRVEHRNAVAQEGSEFVGGHRPMKHNAGRGPWV
jgi:hypothetical protein